MIDYIREHVPSVETILRFIEAQNRPVGWTELMEVYQIKCNQTRSKLRTRIGKLVHQGYLMKTNPDEWAVNPKMHLVVFD